MIVLFAAALALAQGPASLAHDDSLVALRAVVRAHPDSVEALMAAGRYITDHVDMIESHFEYRMEARDYLDRAVRLRHDDAHTWLEYGLLIQKQHYGTDALRALDHAEQLAGKEEATLTTEERARFHESFGRIYQMYSEDSPPGARGDARQQMFKHYRLALIADPGRMSVSMPLLGAYARAKAWAVYLPLATSAVEHNLNDAEAWLLLGLGYHEIGQAARADTAYRRALELATPALRDLLNDASEMLLPGDSGKFVGLQASERAVRNEAFWASRDPLYLTPENERVQEHYSRVAYADLVFSDPWSGTLGRQSDEGRMWIWYGRNAPHLALTKMSMYHYARLTEVSEFLLRNFRIEHLEIYSPTHPAMVGPLAFQMARFRGTAGATDVAIYGHILSGVALHADSLQTGCFAFVPLPWQTAAEQRMTLPNPDAIAMRCSLALRPGHYLMNVEVLGNDRASTGRDSIDIAAWPAGLSISDLLLADRITLSTTAPTTRADLTVDGSPTLAFKPGAPIGMLWETYGLSTDSSGAARYHVKLEVRDARSGLLRALRAVVLAGNNSGTTIEWDGDRQVPGGAALEYATVSMDRAGQGPYRMIVTVTDRTTGASVTTERRFTITQ